MSGRVPPVPAAIIAVSAVVTVVGSFALHRTHERNAKTRYAAAARTHLASDPCAIAPAALAELRGVDERIAERPVSYAIPPARLAPHEAESNLALAALYRQRAGSLDRMGDLAWRRAGSLRQEIAALPRGTLPGLSAANARPIEQQLANGSAASQALADGLRRSADDSRRFAQLLESASRGGNVSPDDLSRLRLGASPAALQRTCLASIAPSLSAARAALAELDRP